MNTEIMISTKRILSKKSMMTQVLIKAKIITSKGSRICLTLLTPKAKIRQESEKINLEN